MMYLRCVSVMFVLKVNPFNAVPTLSGVVYFFDIIKYLSLMF